MSQEHCDHAPISKKEIQDKIDQYGCYIIGIESEDHLPGFAYTIGLTQQFNHPEIICFGLSTGLLKDILNDACELIKNGQSFQPGIDYDDFLEDFPLQFLSVDQSFLPDYFGIANAFYHASEYTALQLVWPDKQSLFPWETGFHAAWKFKQPLLDRNTDFKFYEERNVAVFTTSHVLAGKPILYVYHNEDGAWQFHSEQAPDLKDSKLVCLEEITRIDTGVNELFDLPLGKSAWRESANDPWEWE
ncbi:DUF4262 domain-containing protein [Chitinophaga arvensicola]|uniref:DUF4262 domain-containing protein n=1 Tax=Chitinophaga arvensicola TaxID=29529 RepID=A0A1I0SDP7_9BACT|nr:DUF4262 domain-containing protein [Chitinophaga arvensicola]SEW56353.1 protein of unknown function [Chitinophaga arvensicola]